MNDLLDDNSMDSERIAEHMTECPSCQWVVTPHPYGEAWAKRFAELNVVGRSPGRGVSVEERGRLYAKHVVAAAEAGLEEFNGRSVATDSTEMDHDGPRLTNEGLDALYATRRAPAPLPDAGGKPDGPVGTRWRKRPVEVTAMRVTDEWFDGDHPNPLHPVGIVIDPVERCVFIPTLEGTMRGNEGDWIITGVRGERYPCKPDIFAATYEPVVPAPPAHEATGEMSPPHGIRCDSCLTGAPHERDRHCYSVAQLLEHIAALRASREAERQRADEAEGRAWREGLRAAEAERAGDDALRHLATAERERDEAREQREDLANEILAGRSDLAAANARAEEAERSAATDRTQKDAAYRDYLTERAARLRAEAERDEAKAPFVYCPECDSRKVAIDSDGCCATCGTEALVTDVVARLRNDHQRLAAAEAEVKRLKEREEYVTAIAVDKPVLVRENAALRARAQRLVEAGDEMDGCRDDLRQRCTSCHDKWAAAKADAPAKEGKPCRLCGGEGRIQQGTGTASPDGGEDWRVIDCPECAANASSEAAK